MKYAIIADIHSNLEALNVVAQAVRDADDVICLGDIVGYGPNPNECVEIVDKLKCTAIAGNHDMASIGKLDPVYFNREAREAIEWTAKVLNDPSVKYLGSLTEHQMIHDFEMVHGSLRDPFVEYISNIQEGAATIELMKKNLLFVGHLHIPLVIVKEKDGNFDGWQLNDGDVVELSKFDKIIINVGAVGQPRDMDNRASYGIYDTEAKTVEIKRVSYNIPAVQEKMRKVGLPDFLVERLSYGR
jgi:predicted phosphodiesterase